MKILVNGKNVIGKVSHDLKLLVEIFSEFTNKPIIYTDGACRGNPGPGGWGWCTSYNNNEFTDLNDTHVICDSGSLSPTTNNQMELTAIINALDFLRIIKAKEAIIYSDSKYCVDGYNDWMHRKNWISTHKNSNLFTRLFEHYNGNFKVIWVKGHGNNPGNILADKLATSAIN